MHTASLPHNAHAALNARLKQAFRFTDEDLATNRAGEMTSAQRNRIREYEEYGSCMGWVGLIFFVPIFCLPLVSPLREGRAAENPGIVMTLIVFGIVLVSGVVLFLPGRGSERQDLDGNKVDTAQVQIKKPFVHDRSGRYHFVTIQGVYFGIPSEAYHAFVEGETYIFYHTPRAKLVVSAEHVMPGAESQSAVADINLKESPIDWGH